MSPLEGRVALVTGGARGIGLAISQALLGHGAKVVIADNGAAINGQQADPSVVHDVVGGMGENAAAFDQDIARAAAAKAAIDMAVDRFGGIDIVVNNAAILRDAFLFNADPANWDAVIRTNLSGAFYTMNAAASVLKEQAKAGRGGGRIVNIVSTAGFYGNYAQAAYAAAKAGLFGLTRVAALDMGRSGVTANAVAPFAATRVTDTIRPATPEQEEYKARALKVPAAHVARFVAYLASPLAQNVTGQLFGVRGREVFLFSQARPTEQTIAPEGEWPLEVIAATVEADLAPHFTSAATDLETFSTEPLV